MNDILAIEKNQCFTFVCFPRKLHFLFHDADNFRYLMDLPTDKLLLE